MMNENEVVEAACNYLKSKGFKIIKFCLTHQRGIDIEAEHPITKVRYYVEAKGETSSKPGTNRHGNSYNSSQVFSHASKGVLACIKLRVKYPDRAKQKIMLAIPNSDLYRHQLNEQVVKELQTIGTEVQFFERT